MRIKYLSVLMCIVMCAFTLACAPGKASLPDFTDVGSLPEISGQPPNEEIPDADEPPEINDIPEISEPPSNGGQPQEKPPEITKLPEPDESNYDILAASAVNGLRVRSGRGTQYAAIGTLDKNDMVMPLSESGGWCEIGYKNTVGYVASKYLNKVKFAKADSKTESVIGQGKKLLGMPYVYGAQRYHFGNGKLNSAYNGKSYDCSSLMQYIFKKGANVNLAMTSREQSLCGAQIAKSNIRRGDLLFFTNASRKDKTGLERIGHVALYLGDGIILHTASDHAVIEPISARRDSYYVTARRCL